MTHVTLSDIALKEYTLETLPRLQELRRLSFSRSPEICIERARYVTKYLKQHDNVGMNSGDTEFRGHDT